MSPEAVSVVRVIFWVCLGLVIYPYIIYPVILFFVYSLTQVWRDLYYLSRSRSRRVATPLAAGLPAVSIIVPAYNEEKVLEKKIENIRSLDFPQELLQVIFVSDGSTDRTNAILQSAESKNFDCIFLDKRQGKANALNHAVERAKSPILVFCD